MPIDWEQYQQDIDRLADEAAAKTDRDLARKAAQVTRFSEDEVRRLFPAPADVKALIELMRLVKEGTNRNEQVAELEGNIERFSGVVLTLLAKFA